MAHRRLPWMTAGGVILAAGLAWLALMAYRPLEGVEPWVRWVLTRGALALAVSAAAACFVRAEGLRRAGRRAAS